MLMKCPNAAQFPPQSLRDRRAGLEPCKLPGSSISKGGVGCTAGVPECLSAETGPQTEG